MPTFRDITVSLQSQYDALTIPERLTQTSPTILTNASISSLDLSSAHEYTSATAASTSRSPIINVTIPSFPCSQFWITYTCEPPLQNHTDGVGDEVQYYYFKLFCTNSNKCILSWGVGEKEEWSGKMMYALFSAGTDFEGRRIVEKKGLFFPKKVKESDGASGFGIRVFRAKARKRESVRYESLVSLGLKEGGFDFANLGRVRKGERQRAYTYALIDPKDEPYVTFRYTIRGDEVKAETGKELHGAVWSRHSQVVPYTLPPCKLLSNKSPGRHLSIPPRKKLLPTGSRSIPTSPTKKQESIFNDDSDKEVDLRSAFTADRSKPRDWLTRTPSPMVSRLFELPASPVPSTRPKDKEKQKGSAALLKEVMANKFKKREVKEWEMGKSLLV